jgi:hypothetical protein
MIQPASLVAYTEKLTTGNAAFVRPFFTISPLNGPIARSLKIPSNRKRLAQVCPNQAALCFFMVRIHDL